MLLNTPDLWVESIWRQQMNSMIWEIQETKENLSVSGNVYTYFPNAHISTRLKNIHDHGIKSILNLTTQELAEIFFVHWK